MATFAAVVSDPESGQSYQVDVDGQDANRFLGREIGETVDGDAVGLPGYTVEITGGSDEAGRPMHAEVGGDGLAEVLSDGGTGFQPNRDGERRRVTVRGREVGEATVQLNLRIGDRGDDHPAVLLGDADPEEFADGEEDDSDADEETASEDSDTDESESADEDTEDADAADEEAGDTEAPDEDTDQEDEDAEEASEDED